MRHKKLVLSGQLPVLGANPYQTLLLLRRFLCSLLLRGGFLVCLRLCLGLLFGGRLHLFRLRFLLRKIGSLKTLPAERDLGDTDRSKRLPMSPKLLVLLLPFVVEDDDLRAAAFAQDLTDNTRVGLIADLPFFPGDGDHGELHLPVSAVDLFHSNHIARRHPVLLPTGADNRVHTSASVKCRLKSARQWLSQRTYKIHPSGAHQRCQGAS